MPGSRGQSSIFDRHAVSAAGLATFLLLGVCIIFGGASRQHELRLLLVQLTALPLLVLAIQQMTIDPSTRPSSFATAVLCAIIALPLLQLVPLPPSIWTGLPGRDQAALALDVADLQPGWSPTSLNPDRTWASWLALGPPVAAFLGVSSLRSMERRRLAVALLALTAFSVALGAFQLASGTDNFYPWRTTDAGNVTAFFANRNHFATLCLITLPFAGMLLARAVRHRRNGPTTGLATWLPLLLVAAIIVAVIVSRSRAGAALLVVALAGGVLIAGFGIGWRRPSLPVIVTAGVGLIALVAAAVFGLGPLLERFDASGAAEGRFENWPIVLAAANGYLPIGSGLGTFDAVFRSVEPLSRLDATFFNQAHNDYLETWLETGWLGAALIAAFLVWFGRRTWAAWRGRPGRERDLQRAASVAIGVVLAHSAVDYPLRTETIAVIFAMTCALLDMAARSDEALAEGDSGQRSRRRRSA